MIDFPTAATLLVVLALCIFPLGRLLECCIEEAFAADRGRRESGAASLRSEESEGFIRAEEPLTSADEEELEGELGDVRARRQELIAELDDLAEAVVYGEDGFPESPMYRGEAEERIARIKDYYLPMIYRREADLVKRLGSRFICARKRS